LTDPILPGNLSVDKLPGTAALHGHRAASIPPERRKRLAASDREQQIVDEAVRFFAEVGFSGQTRELAQRLGITQPLLYRYFPTKQDLIDRVFKEVFLKRVDPRWKTLIKDRSKPLQERLVEFYDLYAKAVYRYEWIRIYMLSGLMGEDINKRYIRVIEENALRPICEEIRHHCGLPGADVIPIGGIELEHVWVLHGGLFYYAVRKYIYGTPVDENFSAIVARAVATMLEGLKTLSAG
jgi:AcrR family transcriptional regulator